MEMTLKTVYEIDAIPIITNFVFEVAKYWGATDKEAGDLKLASEEAAEHIIVNFPQVESGLFDIFCFFENGMLKVVLSNMGLPVNKEEIPEYKVEDPNDTIEGLKFFLIKNLTDNFYFVNKGTSGWQTVLEKNFCNPKSVEVAEFKAIEKETCAQNASESLVIETAKPEDAYELTKLAYYTYRYSYAKTVFYYPEMLKEGLANRTIMAFIARNKESEIVVNCAYIRSPYCSEIVEAGALMSNPMYRKNRSLIRLVKKQVNFAKNSKDFSVVETNLVTAHINSQRITRFFGFHPFALKLSVHKRGDFIAMEDIDNQRESLLYSVWFPNKLPEISLYAEECHKGIIERLFANAKIELQFLKDKNDKNSGVETTIDVETNKADNIAYLTLSDYDKDWLKRIKQAVREFNGEGYISFHCKIPAWKPLPDNLDSLLMSVGFFFSGVVAKTPNKWYLLYTKLDSQKFGFQSIKILSDNAIELKNYIENRYLQMLNN
jgi:anti-sigma regulatory factor (Ser/Thr protein kinase)